MPRPGRAAKLILASAITIVMCVAAGAIFLVYLGISYVQGLQIAQHGYRQLALHQYKRAICDFDDALKRPMDAYNRSYVYLNRASAYNYEHRLAESIHDNTEALHLNPKFIPA